jgi:hypothetical protein
MMIRADTALLVAICQTCGLEDNLDTAFLRSPWLSLPGEPADTVA